MPLDPARPIAHLQTAHLQTAHLQTNDRYPVNISFIHNSHVTG